MRISTFLILGSLLVWMGSIAYAQDVPAPPKPPLFSSLFTQPTGLNGYEEWVQAGDLIRNNKLLDAAQEPGATLTLKRQVLADISVQQALHLLRQGLGKQVFPLSVPPQNVTVFSTYDNAVFSSLSSLRALARLLYIQLYVQFANGHVNEAIDTFAEGLQFGYRIQTNTCANGMTGNTIAVFLLKGVSRHLDQLSEYQCNRVRHVVEAYLERPLSIAAVVANEEQEALRTLEAKRSDPGSLKQMFITAFNLDGDFEQYAEAAEKERMNKMMAYLDSQPTDLGLTVDLAKSRLQEHYETAIQNLKLPEQERKPLPLLSDRSLIGTLCLLVADAHQTDANSILNSYNRIDAMLRLLGTHAAIRSYRWEHNSLPSTLAELRLQKLGIDPFTGSSLIYKRNGTTYELSSHGPFNHDNHGVPIEKVSAFLELQVTP